MARRTGYPLLAGLAAVAVLVSAAIFVGAGGGTPRAGTTVAPVASGTWVGAWSAAPVSAEPGAPEGHPDASLRNVVHLSAGGSAARVRLSNLFGTRPLVVAHATVALAATPGGPAAVPGTMRRLTFGTHPEVTVPAGAELTSDAVRLDVPADSGLLVTLHTPAASGPVTHHRFARQTGYLARGDRAADVSGAAYTGRTTHWRYVTAVDVWTDRAEGAVVVLGDSITDGITATFGADHRWTDFLADRLRTEPGAPRYTVLNQGVSGNRILRDAPRRSPANGPAALTRLERDVLSHTGAEVLVVQLGINDILKAPHQTDPARITAGLAELARRAQRHGLRVVGTTLLPFGGHPKHSARLEAVRREVNERVLRGDTGFDAVVDLDAALRDPGRPERLRPAYDSGDHVHPNDAGFRAMAEAVDPALLGAAPPRGGARAGVRAAAEQAGH
ncbi:SGNH/GDSL hydrolase family protein [Streptomyces sp. TRM 70361]|uniref:SGNH/GDSL hydrolase family protein n=1 Tax=Streptomyces sp. TRM 70361 TaxID=3116553 RepID=UPI002E7B8046|nr:SGNH/GDSL hydrolase family protein [Streptomyces sp. TRM 70361]MEE1937910.1 SGNH/GDSL hydrolase family protein [Streptomyces sp. TRM 70361]